MVDANDALAIADDVQARYAQSVKVKVIKKKDLMPDPKGNIQDATWKTLDSVPPSFFDFYNLHLVDPNKDWPSEMQVGKGPGGNEGWSKRYTFYLVAKELGHKAFVPGSPFGKMIERATLKSIQPGWQDYQPFFDALIVDAINIRSQFVQSRFEDMANLIPMVVRERTGGKIARLFSNGAEIITWEEVFCRVAYAIAENEISGQIPNQGPPEADTAGALWPGLKKTPEGKAQMIIAMTIYDAVIDAAALIEDSKHKEFIEMYRFIGTKLKELLGTYAAFIIPPIPLQVSNEATHIDALGNFDFIEQAKAYLSAHTELNRLLGSTNDDEIDKIIEEALLSGQDLKEALAGYNVDILDGGFSAVIGGNN